jgi:AcrR family transcriptional regulator
MVSEKFSGEKGGIPMQAERVVLSHERLTSAIGDRWSAAEVDEVADLLADGDGKFPAGTRTVASELVKAVQRERMIAATLRAVAELGYRETCVQDVLDRAGVSRPTFYEHFENKEDCFLAAFDAAATRLRDQVEKATREGGADWRDRLASGMEALLRFLTAEPDAARTLIVEARAASPAAVRRRDALLNSFGECIEAQVRGELEEPPSSIAAAGVVGGIEAVLFSRVNRGETDDLRSLLPSFMYFAVLPYGGHEAAARELAA